MRNPRPFTVFQTIPGQNFPKPLFVIHAYSLAQARALVAAKVAGKTIVVGPVHLGSRASEFAEMHDRLRLNVIGYLWECGGLAAGGESVDEMRAIVCSTLMALIITTAGAQAQECTPNHELYRIVTEHRAIMLDGGDIKRVMFVDSTDERLKLWEPGHNITYCPDENKMINTTINSVATLLSEFATTCKTLLISDAIERSLQRAWDYTNTPNGDPNVFVTEAKSNLGWYYKICTDHAGDWFENEDFKDFLYVAASLTRVNMAIEDPANASTYKARAVQYEKWRDTLYTADSGSA